MLIYKLNGNQTDIIRIITKKVDENNNYYYEENKKIFNKDGDVLKEKIFRHYGYINHKSLSNYEYDLIRKGYIKTN